MVKLFRGDSTSVLGGAIVIKLPHIPFSLDSYTMYLKLGPIVRTWDSSSGLASSATINVDFDKDETKALPLGINIASLYVENDTQRVTIANKIPIKVTENVSEVYGSIKTASGAIISFENNVVDFSGITDLTREDTLGGVKQKINEVISRLK